MTICPAWSLHFAGMGLHYGEVIIGTVGGGERMDSTAIGDSVNVASRIEGATKIYQVPILATDDVIQALDRPEEFRIRFMDRIRIVGRNEPLGIWEVIGLAAIELQALLELAPEDRPAQLYLERCQRWMKSGNEREWNAVTDLSQK